MRKARVGSQPLVTDPEAGHSQAQERRVRSLDRGEEIPAHQVLLDFQTWFGASQVTNEQGQPRMVYHGTPKEFDAFRAGSRTNPGIWFASLPDEAWGYASPRRVAWHGEYLGSPHIVPAYLRVMQPLVVDAKDSYAHLLDNVELPSGMSLSSKKWRKSLRGSDSLQADDIVIAAQKQGFDGVIFHNMRDGHGHVQPPSTVFAVLHPSQIKNAIGIGALVDRASLGAEHRQMQAAQVALHFLEKSSAKKLAPHA